MFRPILCTYYVTTRCNARCGFCDIHLRDGSDAVLADVVANLKLLKRTGIRFVDFTGGEPLLHPDLPAMLREARRLGLQTIVTTNGLLYPKRAGEIAGLVSLLRFSLDSVRKAVHDALRGVPAFDRVMESLDVSRSLGERPDLVFTVTAMNAGQISEAAEFARRNRLMLLLNPASSGFGTPGPDRKVLDAVLAAASLPYVTVNRGVVRFMQRGGNRTRHPRCRAVTSTVVISPDNTILVPCYHQAVMQIPAETHLKGWSRRSEYRMFRKCEGRFRVCEGCTISSNFDPSFTVGWDEYFFLSRISKVKYIWDKFVRTGFTPRRKVASKAYTNENDS